MKTIFEQIGAVLTSNCASNWLKSALATALTRDCEDAANDAELLAKLLRGHSDSNLSERLDARDIE